MQIFFCDKKVVTTIQYYHKDAYSYKKVFKASALWADALYKSICPSVCTSVRLCVCVSVHF